MEMNFKNVRKVRQSELSKLTPYLHHFKKIPMIFLMILSIKFILKGINTGTDSNAITNIMWVLFIWGTIFLNKKIFTFIKGFRSK